MSDEVRWAEPSGADGGAPVPAPPPAPGSEPAPGLPARPGVDAWTPPPSAPSLYPPPPRPLAAQAWVAVGFLVLTILLSLVGFVHELRIDALMDRVESRDVDDELLRRLDAWDTANAGISGAQLLALLAAAVAFIVWLWRARTNVGSYGWTKQRRSRGWAIGAWFVPFVAFWFPFQVTADIWKASHPKRAPQQGDLSVLRTGVLLRWWWGFWLASRVFGLAANADAGTPDALRLQSHWLAFDEALTVAAAVLAILVVRQITRFQDIRAHAVVPWAVDQDALPSLPRLTTY